MCRKTLMLFLLICSLPIFANEKTSVAVIHKFSQTLAEYVDTKDMGKCGPVFDQLCHKSIKCRVANDLMKYIADNTPSFPQAEESYLFDTYINEVVKMINEGATISIKNIEYDYEMSNTDFIDGMAHCVKCDVVISLDLDTEIKYTDLVLVRDGRITGFYQYSGAKNYQRAMKLLIPGLKSHNDMYKGYAIDLEKADEAFNIFRRIATRTYGSISIKSMSMVVAMEIANIGCDDICQYAREMDLSAYFSRQYTCPKIEKIERVYRLTGVLDKSFYIGKGETTANWLYTKKHPYANNIGSAYLHFISPKFRPLGTLDVPYVIETAGRFGFLSEKGEMIIPCIYDFAYPFDASSSLAAVRDENKKWGFVNSSGQTIISHRYDIVNDVFVNNKNFVIKDNHLILINTNGDELRRIYGYNYLIPKLDLNEIIAYNGLKQQFDVFDFCGNLLLENCFSDDNIEKKHSKYWQYYLGWGNKIYNILDNINEGFFFIPRIPLEISTSDISKGDAVDLGLGVLWRSKNLGANLNTDSGSLYLWGDYKGRYSNGKRDYASGKKYKKVLLKDKLPQDIAGTHWDIANISLGEGWRLPTKKELEDLINKCKWEYCLLNGVTGYRITGPNGNSIFLPIEGENRFESYQEDYRGVKYWSSEMWQNAYEDCVYAMSVTMHQAPKIYRTELIFWNYMRPVKDRPIQRTDKHSIVNIRSNIMKE